MRRTFQDLCRAAEVKDIVTRAVSGHATELMQRHYSTVPQQEMRESLSRVASVISLAEVRGGERGMHRGMHDPETKKAG